MIAERRTAEEIERMHNENLRLADLVKRYHELAAIVEGATEEMESIKATCRGLGIGRYPTGAGPVVVSQNRRWNAELAEKVLGQVSPDLLAACKVTVVDSAKAKAILPPQVYEKCMKASPNYKVAIG